MIWAKLNDAPAFEFPPALAGGISYKILSGFSQINKKFSPLQ
jgi:hypothetical protein